MATFTTLLKSIRDKRYEQDFEKIEKIGRRGYASIYKSRNRLDDQFYAVKKITLEVKGAEKDMEEEIERVLQEAKALARADHPHIIRYYNSWLEVIKNPEESGSQSTSENLKISLLKPEIQKNASSSLKFERDSGDFELDNQNDDDDNVIFSLDDDGDNNVDQKKRSDKEPIKEVFTEKGGLKNSKRLEFVSNHTQFTQASESKSINVSIFESMKLKPSGTLTEPIGKSIFETDFQSRKPNKASTSFFKEIDSPLLKKSKPIKSKNKVQEEQKTKGKSRVDSKQELGGIQRNFFKVTAPVLDKNPLESLKSITLYIQTELCRYTIEDYISKRNALISTKAKNSVEYLAERERYMVEAQRFALQLIKGLKYIHEDCNMVHRDLKPYNIFLTDDNIIKIGGFGLVKDIKFFNALQPSPMLSAISTPERVGSLDQDRSFSLNALNEEANFEFELKIDDDEALSNDDFLSGSNSKLDDFDQPFENLSPENKLKTIGEPRFEFKSPQPSQTSGDTIIRSNNRSPEPGVADSKAHDQKSDIWSLGIIFLLLFYPMLSTEQNIVLNQCENGDFPESFLTEVPVIAKLVQRMISRNPYERPLLKEIESELCIPNNFLGKVLVRRECNDLWKERYVKITDDSICIFKNQNSKKADTILRLEQWAVSLQREGDKQSSFNNLLQKQASEKEDNKSKTQGPLTYINLENKALIGYHFTTDHAPTTEMIYYQITNRTPI